jgi:hypothetical protein
MYTEGHLNVDVQKQTHFFRDMFNREIARIRNAIVTDYRMPREGWEMPYQQIIHICKNAGKNTAALSEKLDGALQSLHELNALAEEEMVDLQARMCTIFDSMENVR